MKKLFLFFALFAFAMSGAAQTTHMVQGIPRTDLKDPRQVNVQSEVTPDIDFNKINAWVGSGKKQAALAVKWHDGNGYTNVYVWGYRWQDGYVKTGADMIAQVAKEDPRFYNLVNSGKWSETNTTRTESIFTGEVIGGQALSDNCVDGCVLVYDFDWNADMGGNIVYVSSLNGIDDNSNTIAPEKVKSRGDVAPTTYTVTSVEELVEAVQSSADGDIIQFDESLRGQELDWGERYSLDIEGKQLSILGNGVILKNSGGFSAINEGKVFVKDFIFDAPKAFVISMETGYMTVDNCTFKNYIHKNGSPLIRVFQTEIYPKKDYFITISNCLFENNSLLTENGKYKNNLIDLAGYRNAKHDFTATFVNNTFVGNKAGKGSCLTAGNYIDVVLVNNVFENNVCTKQGGTDILIDDGDPFLTSAYNVISGTINTEYQNALSSTDIWAEDLETSLELVDGKYYVREDTPAYLHLPANTEIEGVSFPETDIYGNTIDYSKDTNSGCSQLVYDASDVIDYTAGTFIVNEDWYGHQNSTINFLTDGGEWVYRVIQRENEGVQLGCTAQYGTIYGGKMYITSKQDKDPGAKVEGGRLTIADAKTMKVEKQFQTITANGYTGRADGRAFLGVNEHKGYMGTSNGIFILDLDTQEFTGYITTGDDEDLYTGQVGNMIRVNDYVFANHQSQGLLVINAETDEIERAILGPDDAKIGTFTLANDGNLYLMTNKNLLCLDPISLEYSVVELPEGTKLTGEGWGAWTPSTLCASCQQNAIFWGSGSGFMGAKKVLKYDIDAKECSTYFDLSDTDWTIYGCSFRIDPVTDEGVVSLFKTFGDPTYVTRKYNAAGEMVAEYAMESNYWFPSIPIFPDNAAPVVKGTETVSIAEDAHDVISLADFATDADNIDAAIVKSIKSISNRSVIAASIVNGDLIIVPLKKGTATVTIQANSNGQLAESDIIVEVTGTSGISTVEGGMAVPEGTYSLDGKIVGGSYRGVVIIKMSDGTTRKVIR